MRRRMMLNQARLPSEYQEVEWIQSSGTQWIDTNVAVSNNISYEVFFRPISYGSNDYTYWGFGGYLRCNTRNWANAIEVYYTDTQAYTVSISLPDDIKIKQSSNLLYFNDSLAYTFSEETFSFNAPITLFGLNAGGSTIIRHSSMKMYYCQYWNGEDMVRYMIPCYRKSDNEIGMYDLVNGAFYTNQGTGTFTKGSDV